MILGVSGKKGVGKNLVTDIISYLTYIDEMKIINSEYEGIGFSQYYENIEYGKQNLSKGFILTSKWKQKSFAYKLKQIVSILTGCSLEDLENQEFKKSYLSEEWNEDVTYREFLQMIGTDLFVETLHPDTWINALFIDYKGEDLYRKTNSLNPWKFPNWIISDVRFKNECRAIKERDGLIFRIENPKVISTDHHKSEVDLDDYKEFDDIIVNDGTIEELVEKVKIVLQKHKIIK